MKHTQKLSGLLTIASVILLSGCSSIHREALNQDRDKVAALRAANHADRKVARAEQAVTVARAGLTASQVALLVAKREQKKAHEKFEALYLMGPQPEDNPGEK